MKLPTANTMDKIIGVVQWSDEIKNISKEIYFRSINADYFQESRFSLYDMDALLSESLINLKCLETLMIELKGNK